MDSRSDTVLGERAAWTALPGEIRLEILEHLETLSRGELQSMWASVCKEWQIFFEKKTFEVVSVDASELDELNDIVRGHRRAMVKVMFVDLNSLKTYTCEECNTEESPETIAQNNEIFTHAMFKLFSMLSKWDTSSDKPHLRLVLQVWSRSDNVHTYGGFLGTGVNKPSEPHKRWCFEGNHSGWGRGRKKRFLGNPLDLVPGQGDALPEVGIMETLSLFISGNCGNGRILSSASLTKILKSLPRLEKMEYGHCPEIDDDGKAQRDEALICLLRALGPSVAHLHVRAQHSCCYFDGYFIKPYDARLVEAAVAASHQLRVFDVTRMVDARDFFNHIQASRRTDSWPRLTHLSLLTWKITSSLLLAAANVSIRMPNLECMQLWAPHANICDEIRTLSYHKQEEPTCTTIKSWPIGTTELGENVAEMWTMVTGQEARLRIAKLND